MKYSEMFTIKAKKEMFKAYKAVRDLLGVESSFENFCLHLDNLSRDLIYVLMNSITKKM